MKSRLKYIVTLFVFSLFVLSSKGQMRKEANYTLSIEPYTLSEGGLKLNFEKRLAPKNWLRLALSGHFRYDKDGFELINTDREDILRLGGVGMDVGFKHCFERFFYLSAGINYNFFRVKYNEWNYIGFKEDGVDKYREEEVKINQNFNRVIPNICIGVQSSIIRLLYVDAFVGLGYAHSFYDKDKRHFNDNIFSFGYRGLRPMGNLRIGIALNRR